MVRVKRRYFVFQLRFNTAPANSIKPAQIHTTLDAVISRLYGDVGTARFTRNLSIIYYNSSTHTAIVRCLRDDKHMLRTAAAFTSRLANDPLECSIQTLHVGGSIRQCKKYLVNYCVEQLIAMNPQPNGRSQVVPHMFKRGKKTQTNNDHRLVNTGHEKQMAFQKLLAESRLESRLSVGVRCDDDELRKE